VAFVRVCCPDGDIVAELRACFVTVAAWGLKIVSICGKFDSMRLYLDIQVLWRHHAFLIPRLYATKNLFDLH
jgi:hypothetical protein